jgi:hypothetical protein
MNTDGKIKRSWVDMLALLLAFLGAIVSFWGSVVTYLYLAQNTDGPLWPLPGLVFVDWLLIGTISFVVTFFSLRKKSVGWLKLIWFMTGTFIPVIILGASTIGLFVLIAFILVVISTIIIAIRQESKWLLSFGNLMLGSICNLGVLAVIILLSNSGHL